MIELVHNGTQIRRRRRKNGLASAAACITILGASGTYLVFQQHAGRGTPAANHGVQIYFRVPGDGTSDGTLYRQAASTSSATPVAECTDVSVAWSALAPQLTCNASKSSFVLSDVASDNPSGVTLPPRSALGLVATEAVYVATDGQLVETNTIDSTSKPVAIPSLAPDAAAGDFPQGYKGLPPTTEVTALTRTAGGRVLAGLDSMRAAAIYDIGAGTTTPLPGFGAIGSIVEGSDGSIYVVAWRPNEQTYAIRLLQLDPATLKIRNAFDTGISPSTTVGRTLLPTASNGVALLISMQDADAQSQTDLLWIMSSSGTISSVPDLPTNAGIYATEATPGFLYLYGGAAKNTITTVDLSGGKTAQDSFANWNVPANAFVTLVA